MSTYKQSTKQRSSAAAKGGPTIESIVATAAPESSKNGKFKKAVVNLGVLLCSTACCFLLFELGFRLLYRVEGQAWSDRPTFYYKPAGSPTMRDFEYQDSKPADVYRIAVVGDSFTFAPFMQFDDAFPKRLERMLNLGGSSLRAEVMNFGVPGNSASGELWWIRRAIEVDSDLIVLQITLNDPQIVINPPTGLSGANQFAAKPFQPNHVELVFGSKLLAFVKNRFYNRTTHQKYREYYFDLFDSEQTWGTFRTSVKTAKGYADQANVQLVAVVFPLFGVPLDDKYPFHPLHQKIHELLGRIGVPTLDLFELYQGMPLERIHVMPGADFHPNEIAHRMAAERIYQWLVAEGLLPDQLHLESRFGKRTSILPAESQQLDQ